ncbi:MAG TPA: aldo/keto reductase [Porticoccaceae bacterium]|nr:aldo/keto reductase [Porticoccaceae bacterium]
MQLPRRPLGQTGMAVSVLGLGTVKLGRDQGVKYPASFTIPDDREARNLLAQARDLGINLLDTAPAYGTSEARLGVLLADQRNDWLICTKVGEEFIDGASRFDFSPAHTRRSVERSLRRLATDHLDIVLVHSDGNDEHIIRDLGTLETLADLKREGKLRAFGMSTKTLAGGLLAAEVCDCVMVTWNLAHREEVPVIDRCQALGRGVLIKKALASGHLAGAGGDPVAESLAMIFAHPGVSSAIVGTIDPAHLAANAARVLGACGITAQP